MSPDRCVFVIRPYSILSYCHVPVRRFHSGDVLLLRGAVFYVSMSLWGVKRVDTLGLPFTAVLPAIHQVLCPYFMLHAFQ